MKKLIAMALVVTALTTATPFAPWAFERSNPADNTIYLPTPVPSGGEGG